MHDRSAEKLVAVGLMEQAKDSQGQLIAPWLKTGLAA